MVTGEEQGEIRQKGGPRERDQGTDICKKRRIGKWRKDMESGAWSRTDRELRYGKWSLEGNRQR